MLSAHIIAPTASTKPPEGGNNMLEKYSDIIDDKWVRIRSGYKRPLLNQESIAVSKY